MANSLHLSRNGTTQGGPACSAIDITTRWQSILNDDNAWWSGTQYIGDATREGTQADFAEALENGTGWSVAQLKYNNQSTTGTGVYTMGDAVRIVFSPSETAYMDFTNFSPYGKFVSMKNTDGAPVYSIIIQYHDPDSGYSTYNACTPMVTQSIREGGTTNVYIDNRSVAAVPSNGHYALEPLYVNAQVVYPSAYEGESIGVDQDNDGLSSVNETTQGTSDANKDTDSDGLNDYIESQWFANQSDVFCGSSCAYPDPVKKDIYVEVDWMKDGSRSFKPSSAQLGSVVSMFDNKDINLHFDTGQYGGGNELPTYTQDLYFAQHSGQFDFYDYKNGTSTTSANFDTDRKRIWRYLVSGYENHDFTDSSGVAYAGDDDFFVSYGLIEDNSTFDYTNFDTAISGTIAHELGIPYVSVLPVYTLVKTQRVLIARLIRRRQPVIAVS